MTAALPAPAKKPNILTNTIMGMPEGDGVSRAREVLRIHPACLRGTPPAVLLMH